MTGTERMLLRAEIHHDRRLIIGHTTLVAPGWVFVRTDEVLDPGDTVVLELSFARLLRPVRVEAQVIGKEPGDGPGYFPGIMLALVGGGRVAADAPLARLLADRARSGDDATPCVRRILVVEDSPLVRELVEVGADRFSGLVRVEVDAVESAEAALAMVAVRHYDLVVVDLYLPGELSGADLVRRLRTDEVDATPVIGFSIGGAVARDAFLDAGADVFLDKPVMLRDLFATLEHLTMLGENGREADPADG